MTEKGKKSEFLVVIGENAETTHSLYIVVSPIEYLDPDHIPKGAMVPAVLAQQARRANRDGGLRSACSEVPTWAFGSG